MEIQHFGMGEAVWVWRSRYVIVRKRRACHCGYQLQMGMVWIAKLFIGVVNCVSTNQLPGITACFSKRCLFALCTPSSPPPSLFCFLFFYSFKWWKLREYFGDFHRHLWFFLLDCQSKSWPRPAKALPLGFEDGKSGRSNSIVKSWLEITMPFPPLQWTERQK